MFTKISLFINYLLCTGLFFSPFKILPKRYCAPCSNNDDFLNLDEDYFKNNSNITKIDVKR